VLAQVVLRDDWLRPATPAPPYACHYTLAYERGAKPYTNDAVLDRPTGAAPAAAA